MEYHDLGCPEHDLIVLGKCLSVYLSLSVCDTNFVAIVAQATIVAIKSNFSEILCLVFCKH